MIPGRRACVLRAHGPCGPAADRGMHADISALPSLTDPPRPCRGASERVVLINDPSDASACGVVVRGGSCAFRCFCGSGDNKRRNEIQTADGGTFGACVSRLRAALTHAAGHGEPARGGHRPRVSVCARLAMSLTPCIVRVSQA